MTSKDTINPDPNESPEPLLYCRSNANKEHIDLNSVEVTIDFTTDNSCGGVD